jgi:DNA-binding LacI/PurR family transcriptional regulator
MSQSLNRTGISHGSSGRRLGAPQSYVAADNVDGARKAVAYLLDSGRKAVATSAGPPDMSPGIDRLLGSVSALLCLGLNVTDAGMDESA